MIWLSTLIFAKDCDIDIVQTLGGFFVLSRMAQIWPPSIPSFKLSEGTAFLNQNLRSALEPVLRPFAECPESQLARGSRESQRALEQRQQLHFRTNQDRSLTQLVQALESQWPCEAPFVPGLAGFRTYLYTNKVMQIVRPKFKTWYDNYRLKEYLDEVGPDK